MTVLDDVANSLDARSSPTPTRRPTLPALSHFLNKLDHLSQKVNYQYQVAIASTCSGRDEAEDEDEALRGASAAVPPAFLRLEATTYHCLHLRSRLRIKVKPRIHFSRLTPGAIHHALRLQDLPAPGSLSEPPLLDQHLQLRRGPTTDVSTTSFNAYDSRWRSTWRRACPKADQEERRRLLQLVAALIALLPKHHHRQQQPQQQHHQQQRASTSIPTPTSHCLVRDWLERYRHHLTLQR